jgi:hypothetical protein
MEENTKRRERKKIKRPGRKRKLTPSKECTTTSPLTPSK